MNIYQEKRRAQGHHCPCIGGKSSSANSSADNRVTAGTIGISGSGNTVTDGGIVARALDTVDLSNAIGLEGFTKLLDVGESLIGRTQTLVADAYSQASTDQDKTIDNRTIIVLAAAVVAGLYVLNKRG